jgi:hypothetical protein
MTTTIWEENVRAFQSTLHERLTVLCAALDAAARAPGNADKQVREALCIAADGLRQVEREARACRTVADLYHFIDWTAELVQNANHGVAACLILWPKGDREMSGRLASSLNQLGILAWMHGN